MTKLAEIFNKNGDFGDLRFHYSISRIGALQAKAGQFYYSVSRIGTVLKIVCGCVGDSHIRAQKIAAGFGVPAAWLVYQYTYTLKIAIFIFNAPWL